MTLQIIDHQLRLTHAGLCGQRAQTAGRITFWTAPLEASALMAEAANETRIVAFAGLNQTVHTCASRKGE